MNTASRARTAAVSPPEIRSGSAPGLATPPPGAASSPPGDGTSHRFARNLRWLTVSNVLYRLVSVGVAMYLARALGAAVLGQYAAVTNIITLFLSFADLGITNLVIRDVSRDPARAQEYLDTFFSVQVASAVLLALAAIVTGTLSGYAPEVQMALAVGAIGLIASALATVYNALLSAHERMYPFAVIELVCLGVFVVGNVLVVALHGTLIALVAVTTAVGIVKAALGAFWARQHGFVVRGRLTRGTARMLLRLGLPFLLINGTHFAVQRLDVLFLSWTLGDERTGMYAAASRLVFASLFFVSAVGAALYPVFSRLLADARDRAGVVYEHGTVMLVAAGALVALAFRQLAPFVVHALYGTGYEESAAVLRLLGLYIPLFAWGLLASNILMTGDRVWQAVRVSVVALIVMCITSVPFILLLGIRGAAFAVVLAEITATLGYLHHAGRLFGRDLRHPRRAASALLLFLIASSIGDLLPEGVGFAAGMALYLVSLPMLRILAPADIRALFAQLDSRGAAA